MLTFDGFRIGMAQFGQRIQQLMKFRATALAAWMGGLALLGL